ncbi:MAG: hypothetical protein KIT33_12880 [Candidatus Kapabacteria bacterium]|nr:hypothetical protein [Ignavibacteriota bacterium]MCW5885856.1 hypothetical protein [Candidatus Kapabacteria bacterium]
MKKTLFLLILVLFLNNFTTNSQALFHPDNLNFEKGMPGYLPPSWSYSRKQLEAGMIIETSDQSPAEGKLCIFLNNPQKHIDISDIEATTLPIYQILDAIPYRNRKITIKAMAKFESTNTMSKGELWAIGRSTKEDITFSIYQEEKPITSNTWGEQSITFIVPPETNELRIGGLIRGTGKLWLDDFKIEIHQPDNSKDEPSKELTNIELSNLKALSEAYGYLHFFNPANTLISSQEEILTLDAIAKVSRSKNQKELISNIQNYAKSLSPLALINQKQAYESMVPKPDKSIDHFALLKKYNGGPVDRSDELFSAVTINAFSTLRAREASAVQLIDAVKYKGKQVKISASIKVEQASPGANAQIWARADKIASREYVAATSAETPAMSSSWKRYEVSMDLPDDIHVIKLALVFLGEGKSYFDDVKIDIVENGKKIDEITVFNSGFELIAENGMPEYWSIEDAVIQAGYSILTDSLESTKGKFSLKIESDNNGRLNYPLIGKYYSHKISNDLYLHHPYIYYGDGDKPLPEINIAEKDIVTKPSGYNLNYNDNYTRIAATIKLWNIIKHFSPNPIEERTLDSALTVALKKSSTDKDIYDFHATVRSLLLITKDGRSAAWHPEIAIDYSFPFVLRYINDRVLVSNVVDTTLNLSYGDELVSIDGIPINNILNNIIHIIPGNNNSLKILKALTEIRSGNKDSEAILKFRKSDGSEIEDKYKRNFLMQNVFEFRPPAIAELDSGYVYIDLTEMNDVRLRDYIEPLSERKGLILDLRGFTSVSEYLLAFFKTGELSTPKWSVPVYTFPNHHELTNIEFGGKDISGNGKLSDKKLIFLIDEKTTGYAEAIISMAKANKIGQTLGQPTSGYASESIAFRLYGNMGVSFAGLMVNSPEEGKAIFGSSIQPDILMDYEVTNLAVEYDNFILKALELIKK